MCCFEQFKFRVKEMQTFDPGSIANGKLKKSKNRIKIEKELREQEKNLRKRKL